MAVDMVIVGAGMVGASCAYAATAAGLSVMVIDRTGVAAGTSGSGEGNILISDKEPGPELDLALWSNRIWRAWGEEIGAEAIELEPKGGLVVAATETSRDGLGDLADRQAAAGVRTAVVAPGDLTDYETHIAPGLAGGVYYPEDMQVQPMLAAAHLLRASRAEVRTGREFLGVETAAGGRLTAVVTDHERIPARWVVNAAGTWGAEVSQRMGAPVPVLPRRGFILVTEPLPPLIRHKVYTADYVANVASGDEGLETSTVVEGTRSGTILIGASRERVGFDRTLSIPVVRRLARGAIDIFPALKEVQLMRVYRGFRPYCPDHLPVVGLDPRVDGVAHACGHEGAGIGLAPATGQLIADQVTGGETGHRALSPERFAA